MDIFVRGIPAQASDNSLKRFFEDKLSAFGIHAIHLQKLRSKTLANITVLDEDKAAVFLHKYGTTAPNRAPALVLKFMNVTLHCQQSRNPPDELILRALKKKVLDKENNPKAINDGSKSGPVDHKDRRFGYTMLSCGRWEYTDLNELVFVPQTTTADPGSLVLGKRNIILVEALPTPEKLRSNNPHRLRMDIPTKIVDSITIDSRPRPPRFAHTFTTTGP